MRTGGKYRSSGPGWRPPSTERDGGAGGSGLAGLRASGVAGKVYRVGLIFTTLPVFEVDATPGGRALLEGLRQLGYEEGRNLVLERRSAEGKRERYLEIAAELVRLKTDVISPSMFRAGTERRPQRAPQGFKPRYAVVQPESSTPHRRWAVPGARGRACACSPLYGAVMRPTDRT